ncbi:MAG: peptidoglycan editing factor PgeF [Myxococcales bacterium]|nr:peptidoglycan editing factor PgeF [Myxococcales bacterium]
MTRSALRHPLLDACGVEHGFGLRGVSPSPRILRPRQVHGAAVTTPEACTGQDPAEADAVVSRAAGVAIGVATADCVPILLATARGDAVAAVHAGWRGLARGVVASGVEALRRLADPHEPLVAVLGPHIGPCCYEVDRPVLDALEARFPQALPGALRPAGRPGHALLDLALLARAELAAAGIAPAALGAVRDACTCCDAGRFHSFRRDGARAGRLLHFITARSLGAGPAGSQA